MNATEPGPASAPAEFAMGLDEVGTFVSAVEFGSLAAAARYLGVPRSTVSRRLARLEERLNIRLLARTTRKVSLTEEGRAYFERVAPAIETLRLAGREAAEVSDAPVGTVRLTAPVDFGQGGLAILIERFAAAYPEINLHIDLTDRIVDLVAEGFDLAVRAGPSALADSSLVARRVAIGHFQCFASPRYLEAHPAPTTPAELKDHQCVLFRPKGGQARWQLCHPEEGTVEVDVHGRITCTEFGFVRAAARANLGIGLMPAFQAAPDVDSGDLVPVLPGWSQDGGIVSLMMPSGRLLPAKTRVLVDFLVDWFGDQAAIRHR